jgi:hypothetical protein
MLTGGTRPPDGFRARPEAALHLTMTLHKHILGLVFLSTLCLAQEPVLPAPDPIEGRWTGTITAPQGDVAELGLEFFRTKRGALIFRLHFPAMFTHHAVVGIPVEADGQGNYAITEVFAIKLHRDGDRLTGTFGAGLLPLALKRGGKFSEIPPAPVHPPVPAPLWKHDLGSGTWAPPVVAGDAVYVGTSDGRFHAVNAADGSARWVWPGRGAAIDGRAGVEGDGVWFLDTKFNLVALNRADGSLRWSVSVHDEKLAGKPAPDNPTFNHRAATPLLLDGVLYVGSSDGGLYALAAATGKILWRHDARAPVYSGVGLHGADALMFGTMDGSVVLLDRRTGIVPPEYFPSDHAGGGRRQAGRRQPRLPALWLQPRRRHGGVGIFLLVFLDRIHAGAPRRPALCGCVRL